MNRGQALGPVPLAYTSQFGTDTPFGTVTSEPSRVWNCFFIKLIFPIPTDRYILRLAWIHSVGFHPPGIISLSHLLSVFFSKLKAFLFASFEAFCFRK